MTEDNRHNPDPTRLEQLYRRAADAEPDSRIDEAVLGKAHGVSSKPRRRALWHPGAWGVGLAAAASLVLAVGLIFQYGWQPVPESEQLNQFRARAEMEQAARPSAPAGSDSRELDDAAEPAAIRESVELNRVEVTGARSRDDAGRDGQESRKAEVDEAHVAAPPPAEEGEQSSPRVWLDRIRVLAEEGKLAEARKEMRNFRDTHPSVRIPVEIQEALATESD